MSLAFIRILEKDIDAWMSLKENPDTYVDFANRGFLLKARIIVENPEDDLSVYLADVLKNRYNSADMALTILPTRGCNFGCIYCYEQDRQMINMDEKTEASILAFVKANKNVKRLSVVWYGGEPLMNFPSVERLSNAFKDLPIEYSAKMITNGYLLTKEIADKLETLSIRSIQITLDGPEPVHDQRRMLLGGQPTYRRIMENLKYLLDANRNLTIDIRTNVDRRNMEEYDAFYAQFKAEIDDPRVNLYPGFVSDLLSSECISAEHNISAGGYKARFVIDMFNRYGIEIKSFLPKYRRHSCVASKYWAFVIGPEGELYKCWRMVGNKQQVIGNVNFLSIDMAKFSKYLTGADYTHDAQCLNCEFITLCGGGCPLVRMRNKYEGSAMNHCCPEKFHMNELMEMRYEMFLKQNAMR